MRWCEEVELAVWLKDQAGSRCAALSLVLIRTPAERSSRQHKRKGPYQHAGNENIRLDSHCTRRGADAFLIVHYTVKHRKIKKSGCTSGDRRTRCMAWQPACGTFALKISDRLAISYIYFFSRFEFGFG